jgi:serine/threonine protein kinase
MLNLQPGMSLGGRRLVRRLRDGDGRQVFSAVDVVDGRTSVVKIASLESRSDTGRLEREFAVLRATACPGVVSALEHVVAPSQDMAWLTLEAHGPSLASVLTAAPERRLSTDKALAAIYAAAKAVGELHAQGWRHGDLKPGNLLCNADGGIILSDLEFASRLSDEVGGRPLELRTAGTPPFVAPELWSASTSSTSAAADVWALGVTLYLCLLGEYPFGHEGDLEIAAAITRAPPQSIDRLSQPLATLLNSLLAHDPSARPADGLAAARLIASTAEKLGINLDVACEAFGRLAMSLPQTDATIEPMTFVSLPTTAPATAAPPVEIKSTISILKQTLRIDPAESFDIRRWESGAVGSKDLAMWPAPSPSHDFLDVASVLAMPFAPPRDVVLPPAPATAPSQSRGTAALRAPTSAPRNVSPAATAATTDARLVRRAAARWYRRMNPERNFPLSVVISGKEIRIVGGSGLGITLGQRQIELDPADPVLSVEPSFPGCLISPSRADVLVSDINAVCRFWITPLARGDLSEACVTIRYRGKVVETLPTPTKVVTRTLAAVLAALGLLAPIANHLLTIAGWNFDDLLRRWLPFVADRLTQMGPTRLGLCATGALLAAALFYFYVTRPLLSEDPEPSLLPQRA